MTFEALLDKCLDNDVLALYQLYEYQLTLEDINHLFNHLESISESGAYVIELVSTSLSTRLFQHHTNHHFL